MLVTLLLGALFLGVKGLRIQRTNSRTAFIPWRRTAGFTNGPTCITPRPFASG